MKKIFSWRKIFVIILILVTVLSAATPALAAAASGFNWGGDYKDGSAASSVATGGYSIMYGTAGGCVIGYRFCTHLTIILAK